jgi:hypothetical protein
MLNPSIADARIDDRTVRRCISFAMKWGYDGFHVCNLFAFRSSKPSVMKKALNPIGPLADKSLMRMAHEVHSRGGVCVAAWGDHGTFMGRDKAVRQMFRGWEIPLYAFGLSVKNNPFHPLYRPGDTQLIVPS